MACILCRTNPPIERSHVVPNFFVRHIKRQSPVPYLKNSEALDRYAQDGWKGPYLCLSCEARVSDWEGSLAEVFRQVVAMRDRGAREPVSVDEKVWLAVASIHLRWLSLAQRHPSAASSRAAFPLRLYDSLHAACSAGADTGGVHLYLAAFEKVGPPSHRPPGFNSYAFMSIDGVSFDYEDADHNPQLIACVKPPGLCLLASTGTLSNLATRPVEPAQAELSAKGGTARPFPMPDPFWILFGPFFDGRVADMQSSYATFSSEDLKKIEDWAAKAGAPPGAAAWHEADVSLLAARDTSPTV